jgi:uncharacterized phiE125 gp8 family phage protein
MSTAESLACGHIVLVTDVTVEPVTLDMARSHLRVDGDHDDNDIERLITAAREECEHYTGRQLAPATYDWLLDGFPDGPRLYLPRPPLTSVTSLSYRDTAGSTQVWSSSNYEVFASHVPGFIQPVPTSSWPDTYSMPGSVTVRFVCGYASGTVPDVVIQGILMVVQDLYDRRGAAAEMAVDWSMPTAARRLWDRVRVRVQL